MESINNAANAASRAIYGDSSNTQNTQSGQEPVSGQTGNTSIGEPYDAGNAENSTNTESTVGTSKNTDSSSSGIPDSGVQSSNAQGNAPGNTANTGPLRPEHDTEKTGVTSANKPSNAFGSDRPTNSNDNSGPGAAPSVGAHPASGAQDTQKHQGADRPHDEPGQKETSAIQDAKADAEKTQNVDTSGPGPKPLAETHGDAGKSGSSGGDDDGPQKESHGEGTGEKYVKSSGMKADGGDFDAANPGAGKEADRLLETKGVHREAPGQSGGHDKDPVDDKAEKPSLGEKIKAKLHKS